MDTSGICMCELVRIQCMPYCSQLPIVPLRLGLVYIYIYIYRSPAVSPPINKVQGEWDQGGGGTVEKSEPHTTVRIQHYIIFDVP